MSLRTRLLLALTVLAAAALIAAAGATYLFERSFLESRLDRTVAGSARSLTASLVDRPTGLDPSDVGSLESATPGLVVLRFDRAGIRVPLFSRRGDGDEPAVSPAVSDAYREPLLPPLPSRTGTSGQTITTGALAGPTRYRVRIQPTADGGFVVVAAPLASAASALRHLLAVEAAVTVVALAILFGLVFWLVRVGLRPLEEIETTASAIAAGDLSRRIARVDERTEVGRLGSALNDMLTTIERGFAERLESEERLRRFVADASHELRTPLASVRAYAELFDRGARDHPDDLERAMAGIGRETGRMSLIVDDLLLLARLDEGVPLTHRAVDLVDVCREAVAVAAMLEPDRAIAFDAAGPVVVLGDADRLHQILDNLLANVRAHTPRAAPARVDVSVDDGRAIVTVKDGGPGLEPGVAERIFERFYRSNRSRSRSTGGSGLGLAVVAAIAEDTGVASRSVTLPGAAPASGSSFRLHLRKRMRLHERMRPASWAAATHSQRTATTQEGLRGACEADLRCPLPRPPHSRRRSTSGLPGRRLGGPRGTRRHPAASSSPSACSRSPP